MSSFVWPTIYMSIFGPLGAHQRLLKISRRITQVTIIHRIGILLFRCMNEPQCNQNKPVESLLGFQWYSIDMSFYESPNAIHKHEFDQMNIIWWSVSLFQWFSLFEPCMVMVILCQHKFAYHILNSKETDFILKPVSLAKWQLRDWPRDSSVILKYVGKFQSPSTKPKRLKI